MRPNEGNLDLAFRLGGLVDRPEPASKGRTVPALSGDGDISVRDGVRLLAEEVKDLRGQSATIRALSLSLGGAGAVSLAGTIAVDADGLIDADLTLGVREPKALAAALVAAIPGSEGARSSRVSPASPCSATRPRCRSGSSRARPRSASSRSAPSSRCRPHAMSVRLLSVGALTLDTILRIDHLPAGQGKFLASDGVQIASGMAASAACAAQRLGADVSLWASAGDDAAGDLLVAGISRGRASTAAWCGVSRADARRCRPSSSTARASASSCPTTTAAPRPPRGAAPARS